MSYKYGFYMIKKYLKIFATLLLVIFFVKENPKYHNRRITKERNHSLANNSSAIAIC